MASASSSRFALSDAHIGHGKHLRRSKHVVVSSRSGATNGRNHSRPGKEASTGRFGQLEDMGSDITAIGTRSISATGTCASTETARVGRTGTMRETNGHLLQLHPAFRVSSHTSVDLYFLKDPKHVTQLISPHTVLVRAAYQRQP